MKRQLFIVSVLFAYVTSGCADNPPLGGSKTPSAAFAQGSKTRKAFTNSVGMRMVPIEPGSFVMGESAIPLPNELTKNLSYPKRAELIKKFPHGDPKKFAITVAHVRNGDFDEPRPSATGRGENPAHRVNITKPFYMAACEVTNAQYEQFDPAHRQLRGKNGFSKEDDEAVVFVNWHEAKAFCDWLSKKEGMPYRLPTEAEWEYACRAGTMTPFWTGFSLPEEFHKNARRTSFQDQDDVVPLTVGQTPANRWGLYDMHGNIEEWCYDWYGPYDKRNQTDPLGRIDGDFKVTRGGSHGTNLYYLRSANRMGTLPENKHWLIGFRVVRGELPKTKPLPVPPPQRHQRKVKQKIPRNVTKGPDPDKPYFKGPRRYVRIPEGSIGPLFSHHNHDPAVVECQNGDLLAIWYTCVEERGRELAVAASRLRFGRDEPRPSEGRGEWEPASLFWDTPDRNDHCPALWFDGEDTIYHFNGLSVAGKWEPLAIIMRTSKDNGATWSKARLIAPEHGFRQMVGEPAFRTRDGAIVFGADAEHGSTVWVSRDKGLTWSDPGGKINGIHAGIVELNDGRLMALGRNQNIDGWMPKSVSTDMGKSWEPSASPFPPLTGGQRAALIRLKEGPLFFASFAKDIHNFEPTPNGTRPPRHVAKLFGAVSFDDGKSWPVRRIISDCKDDHQVDTIDSAPVLMNANNSEPLGYLSVCQGLDNVIHLISSVNHYAFNLAWLEAEPSAAPTRPMPSNLPVRKQLLQVYDAKKLPSKAKPPWHFVIEEKNVVSSPSRGMLRIGGKGKLGAYWSNERIDGLGQADPHKGLTAEVAVQVPRSGEKGRGFDFEVFVRGGTLTVNHYLISITETGVYYWYDNEFIEIARGYDNRSQMHTYRLAIRDDTAVQIYRDGTLLGVEKPDLQIGWREPARGSFIKWGIAGTGTEALVSHIGYALNGPSQPARR